MTSELTSALLNALVSFLLGFGTGQFLAFRRVRDGQVPRWLRRFHIKIKDGGVVPAIDPHPFRRTKVWPLVLIVLFLTATWYVVDFSQDQRTCNREFRSAIAERAAANADTERARQDNDEALANLVDGLLRITSGAPDAREQTRRLLEEFARTSGEVQRQAAESAQRRAANPYPRC